MWLRSSTVQLRKGSSLKKSSHIFIFGFLTQQYINGKMVDSCTVWCRAQVRLKRIRQEKPENAGLSAFALVKDVDEQDLEPQIESSLPSPLPDHY